MPEPQNTPQTRATDSALPPARHGLSHRGRSFIRAALLIIAAVLVTSTAFLFVDELSSVGRPPALGRTVAVGNARSIHAEAESACYIEQQPEGEPVHVIVVVSSFDPRAETANLDVSLCIPATLWDALYVEEEATGKRHPVSPQASFRITPQYANIRIGVGYEPIVPSTSGEGGIGEPAYRTTTVRRLFEEIETGHESAPSLVPVGHFVIPLETAPRRYPFDWYAASGKLNVEAPGTGLRYCEEGTPCDEELPFRVSVAKGPAIAPFVLSAGAAARRSEAPLPKDYSQVFTLRLERAATSQWYTVVVAAIPLLLGLLLGVVLLGVTARNAIGAEAIAGIAAVLLAILPIRLVLVPSDISELTLVDYALGFEMAALAALACLVIRRALARDNEGGRA